MDDLVQREHPQISTSGIGVYWGTKVEYESGCSEQKNCNVSDLGKKIERVTVDYLRVLVCR